jgi:hypothetical protein
VVSEFLAVAAREAAEKASLAELQLAATLALAELQKAGGGPEKREAALSALALLPDSLAETLLRVGWVNVAGRSQKVSSIGINVEDLAAWKSNQMRQAAGLAPMPAVEQSAEAWAPEWVFETKRRWWRRPDRLRKLRRLRTFAVAVVLAVLAVVALYGRG